MIVMITVNAASVPYIVMRESGRMGALGKASVAPTTIRSARILEDSLAGYYATTPRAGIQSLTLWAVKVNDRTRGCRVGAVSLSSSDAKRAALGLMVRSTEYCGAQPFKLLVAFFLVELGVFICWGLTV